MNYHALVRSIVVLNRDSLGRAAAAANRSLVLCDGLINADLVEFEENGEDRAAYGERLTETVTGDLKWVVSRAFSYVWDVS